MCAYLIPWPCLIYEVFSGLGDQGDNRPDTTVKIDEFRQLVVKAIEMSREAVLKPYESDLPVKGKIVMKAEL